MNLFSFLPPELYHAVFVVLITLLCLLTSAYYSFSLKNNVLYAKSHFSIFLALLLSILIILFLGPRPVHIAFVDTGYYVFGYENKIVEYKSFSFSEEWLWNNFEFFCKKLGLSSTAFLLLVEFLYVGLAFIVSYKLFPKNTWISMLFFLSSFSFYAYGVNGIRNGLACHICMLSIVLLTKSRFDKLLSILLIFVAYGIHRSVMVPIICSIASLSLIKDVKSALYIWVISIFVSLLFGNFIGNFMNEMGLFEDKSSYFIDVELSENADSFSKTGFRFDFLLYSAVPILLIWYLTIKRNFQDRTYNLIANTYILSNAFWIMVIRASYSNRFAYLSWFLYPLVIVYPLLRMRIWENQDRKLAIILVLYSGFTFFMSFVYYG